MRIFKKFLFPAAFLTASALEIPTVQACGPFLQSSYINPKDGYFYSVRMDRDEMLRYFIETSDDLFKNSPVFHYGMTSSEGEKHDFRNAWNTFRLYYYWFSSNHYHNVYHYDN